jgi:hypothetical protein
VSEIYKAAGQYDGKETSPKAAAKDHQTRPQIALQLELAVKCRDQNGLGIEWAVIVTTSMDG